MILATCARETARRLAATIRVRKDFHNVFDAQVARDPDRFLPILLKLLDDAKPAVRDAAAERLLAIPRAEALRPLLPRLGGTWPSFSLANKFLELLHSIAASRERTRADQIGRDERRKQLIDVANAAGFSEGRTVRPAVLKKAVDEISTLPGVRAFNEPGAPNVSLIESAVEHGVFSNQQIVEFIEELCRISRGGDCTSGCAK